MWGRLFAAVVAVLFVLPALLTVEADLGSQLFRFPELSVDDYLVFVPADGSNTEHVQVW